MDVEAYFELGVLSTRKHRDEEAVAFFQQVVRMDPDHVRAQYNLGVLAARRGDHAEEVMRYQILKGLDRYMALLVRDQMRARY